MLMKLLTASTLSHAVMLSAHPTISAKPLEKSTVYLNSATNDAPWKNLRYRKWNGKKDISTLSSISALNTFGKTLQTICFDIVAKGSTFPGWTTFRRNTKVTNKCTHRSIWAAVASMPVVRNHHDSDVVPRVLEVQQIYPDQPDESRRMQQIFERINRCEGLLFLPLTVAGFGG